MEMLFAVKQTVGKYKDDIVHKHSLLTKTKNHEKKHIILFNHWSDFSHWM